jgi:hypothetical protein
VLKHLEGGLSIRNKSKKEDPYVRDSPTNNNFDGSKSLEISNLAVAIASRALHARNRACND